MLTVYVCISCYIFVDHKVLIEEVDSGAGWSVKIAQHLLSKLAVSNTYTVAPYSTTKELKDEPLCLCRDRDKLVGNIGDTSYGMFFLLCPPSKKWGYIVLHMSVHWWVRP